MPKAARRASLRDRKGVGSAEHRTKQLMQTGEGKVGLALDARCGQDRDPARPCGFRRRGQDRRLSDPRITPNNEGATMLVKVVDEVSDACDLAVAAEDRGR